LPGRDTSIKPSWTGSKGRGVRDRREFSSEAGEGGTACVGQNREGCVERLRIRESENSQRGEKPSEKGKAWTSSLSRQSLAIEESLAQKTITTVGGLRDVDLQGEAKLTGRPRFE